jgi:acyl carrier protein phosphodiesterase
MNFVAHAHVALRCRAGDWAYGFGATLPDLASMAGVRIDRARLADVSVAVDAGVALHHQVDSAFHALAEFRQGSGQIRDRLLAVGLPTGAARAVGHAGYELLLDGCLLGRVGVVDEFTELLALAPDVAEAIAPGDPARWRVLFSTMRDDRWWLGYADPDLVARALYRRLRGRTRLCFAEDALPAVGAVLATARLSVADATDRVVETVTAIVDLRN